MLSGYLQNKVQIYLLIVASGVTANFTETIFNWKKPQKILNSHAIVGKEAISAKNNHFISNLMLNLHF